MSDIVTHEDFEHFIEEGIAALPEHFREKIKNVVVVLEDVPSEDVRKVERLEHDTDLLGYYHGVPLPERGEGYGIGETYPDTVHIYKKATIEAAAGDREKVRVIVIDTVWHEFGHYFGLDDAELYKREGERGK